MYFVATSLVRRFWCYSFWSFIAEAPEPHYKVGIHICISRLCSLIDCLSHKWIWTASIIWCLWTSSQQHLHLLHLFSRFVHIAYLLQKFNLKWFSKEWVYDLFLYCGTLDLAKVLKNSILGHLHLRRSNSCHWVTSHCHIHIHVWLWLSELYSLCFNSVLWTSFLYGFGFLFCMPINWLLLCTMDAQVPLSPYLMLGKVPGELIKVSFIMLHPT